MLVNSVRLVYIHSYYDYGKSAIRKILMYLLDTNICIYAIKGKYPVIAEKLLSIHPSDIKISAVTVMELEYGAAKSNWSDRSREAIKTFLASFEMLNATATKPTEPKPELPTPTPQPTPTESKAPEKKEDPWKAIRGMGRANEIIADLEAGGVMSFSELSGFFFNTPHDDDHTTELTDLRKKFTAIDTLIEKMKHRDELEPVYKEYQGKSGWSQSRFKKKNAATIEDYEQTVKYIKEHIKDYYIDGKVPKRSELAALSKQLKDKRKAIMPEHKAYLLKHDTAFRYTRQVRQYLNEQYMKREREKSRQRAQAKRRNKNALE